ncbi:MAG: hypothetical protein K0V04_00045 [Deltaproteobacteria bacterium]|nr:hypothetical protein [Deltaproteobacteria bacterium]
MSHYVQACVIALAVSGLGAACDRSSSEPTPAAEPARSKVQESPEAKPVAAAAEPDEPLHPGPGVALLNSYVGWLKQLAQNGSVDGFAEALKEERKRCDSALARGTIDAEFHRRLTRLHHLTELILRPASTEEREVIAKELTAFVREVEGSTRTIGTDGGLADISESIAEEVLRLYEHVAGPAGRKAAEQRHFPPPG